MNIIQHPGNFKPDEDDDYTMAEVLAHSHDIETCYILDDEGFKAEFGDKWEEMKDTCVLFCEMIHQRNYMKLSGCDIAKHYDTLHSVMWVDIARTMSENKVRTIIDAIYCKPKHIKDKERILKILYGGDSTESTGTLSTRK